MNDQDEINEEFEKWFWDKYNNQPNDLKSWCNYWAEEKVIE